MSAKSKVYEWFSRQHRLDVPNETFEHLPDRQWRFDIEHPDFPPCDAVATTKKAARELAYEQFDDYLPTIDQLNSPSVLDKMNYLASYSEFSFRGDPTFDGYRGELRVRPNSWCDELIFIGRSLNIPQIAGLLTAKLRCHIAQILFNYMGHQDDGFSTSDDEPVFDAEAPAQVLQELELASFEEEVGQPNSINMHEWFKKDARLMCASTFHHFLDTCDLEYINDMELKIVKGICRRDKRFCQYGCGDTFPKALEAMRDALWKYHYCGAPNDGMVLGGCTSKYHQFLHSAKFYQDTTHPKLVKLVGVFGDTIFDGTGYTPMDAFHVLRSRAREFYHGDGKPNSACPEIYCGPGTPEHPKGFPPAPTTHLVRPPLGQFTIGSPIKTVCLTGLFSGSGTAYIDPTAVKTAAMSQFGVAYPTEPIIWITTGPRTDIWKSDTVYRRRNYASVNGVNFVSGPLTVPMDPMKIVRTVYYDHAIYGPGNPQDFQTYPSNVGMSNLVQYLDSLVPVENRMQQIYITGLAQNDANHVLFRVNAAVDFTGIPPPILGNEDEEVGRPNSAMPTGAAAAMADQGSKSMQPVIPNVPADGGNTSGSPPVHADMPASSTMAPSINAPSDPQVRASRDMPAQYPLMNMVGGPPNMASMNMYQDDLLNLVYREFDLTTVTIQGGQAKGTIVASLPYGINLLNPYAQTWARLHKRYNGRIRVTVSISAVPMLKGNILVGVVRNMPPTGTTTFSTVTLQKINWTILNLNGSGDYQMDIGDARQTEFFRNISEDPPNADPVDMTSRPGIIAVVYTPITNQFGGDADNTAVLNFRSQAISPAEDPITGFYTYEPLDFTELVSTTPIRSVPQYQFLQDLIPSSSNRSLYLDGQKFVYNDVANTHNQAVAALRLPDLRFPEFTTSNALPFALVKHDGTSNARFLFTVTTIPPPYLSWADESRSYHDTDNATLNQLIAHGLNGNLLLSSSGAKFLGYYSNTAETPLIDYGAWFGDSESPSWGSMKATQVVYLVYDVGLVCLFSCQPDSTADVVYLGFGRNPDRNNTLPYYEQTARSIVAGFPSSDFTLPTGYYNVVCATDGQVGMVNPVDTLPVLIPDLSFTQTIFKQKANFPLDSSKSQFAVDLVDFRDGSLIGTLCTYENQIVLRTEVPVAGRSHYRINIDLRFLALTNPRSILTVPLSISSPWLDLFEPPTFSPATQILNKLRNARSDNPRIQELQDMLANLFLGEIGTPNSYGAFSQTSLITQKGVNFPSRNMLRWTGRRTFLPPENYESLDGDDEPDTFQNLEPLVNRHVPDYSFEKDEVHSPANSAIKAAAGGALQLGERIGGESLSTFGLFSGLAGGIGGVAQEIVGDIGQGLLAKQRFGYENQLQNSRYKLESGLSSQNFKQHLQEMQFGTQQDLLKRGIINGSVGRGSATNGI